MYKSILVLALSLSCSCSALAASLWSDASKPVTSAAADSNPVEVGVKFTAETTGVITGVRFYKGAGNTGTHTAHLWTASGKLLASATFVNESESGWQQVYFSTPVPVAPNTVYVASYHAPVGSYAADHNYFTANIDSSPLHIPAAGRSGGNGVYAYGSSGTFPNAASTATNYWVDVVFETRPAIATDTPLLLLTSAANNFTQYYTEILHAEGLNWFATADVADLSRQLLDRYDTVVLGEMPLTTTQVDMLTGWVKDGGNLIAMRPDKKLAGLLGLTDQGTKLSDRYLKVAQNGPGQGIVAETIQFHGDADVYKLNGATSLASLYANASVATENPAVTLRGVDGGYAAAFTYDLARSVVYTRQGDPNRVGQDSDGDAPIRTNDLFFPDYVDLNKVAIPQADEQQRLLANLITQVTLNKKPLPRFWYLPNGVKAAIVHALDDHNGEHAATRITHDKLVRGSSPNCSVPDWECLRATTWAYANIQLTDAEAATYVREGFEIGVHASPGTCANFTSFEGLNAIYNDSLSAFASIFPSVPQQTTHRYHCIVWSDWLTQAEVELSHGMRYSMDYYYWGPDPDKWIKGRAGLFTGSGIPMRFAKLDGSTIDIYQGVSQLVNQNGLNYPDAIGTLIDRAQGPEGYYGIFGTHDDFNPNTFVDGLIRVAQAKQVPIITAQQALTWLDGRNGSSFRGLRWNGNTLDFTISVAPGARNLQAMLPVNSTGHTLTSIARNGAAVTWTVQTIKGIEYAFFATTAAGGTFQAVYDKPRQPPAANGLTLWTAQDAPVRPAFDDQSSVEVGVKFQAEVAGYITGIRFYKGTSNTGEHIGNLWNSDGLNLARGTFFNESDSGWQQLTFATPVAIRANTTYVASYHTNHGSYAADYDGFTTARSVPPLRALANSQSPNGVYRYGPSAFPTDSNRATNYWVDVIFTPRVPSTLWDSSARPGTADDPSAVELGVKFFAETAGKIKGIRFYKGSRDNSGPHKATLWDSSGAPLASADFSNETDSGWQEVLFTEPVNIAANTTYVASYFAPKGRYAATANGLAAARDNPPLHAPASTDQSGNGVYKSGAGFPTLTYKAHNYWVDVLFEPND